MSFFLLLSMPLVSTFILAQRWGAEREPRRYALLGFYLKGLLCFFPGAILLAVIRGIIGDSLTGFTLFLSVLAREHIIPLGLAAGAFALLQPKLKYPASDDGIVLTAFFFLSGFYALFGVMEFFAVYGDWGASDLFLIPLLRLAAVISLSAAAPRFYRFQGTHAAAFIAVAAAICVPLGFMSWIYAVNLKTLAVILAGGAFAGSLAVFAFRNPEIFPRLPAR
jgi:hypothetical protein